MSEPPPGLWERVESCVVPYAQLGRAWAQLAYARVDGSMSDRSLHSFSRALALGYRHASRTSQAACSGLEHSVRHAALDWLRV